MTEHETTVSVIIPTYNCARFVGDAIASALNQSYENFEVVVIDDGSTDDTRAVVESCKESTDRVRYIPQENGGVSSARNHGIAKSEGEYLLFLDADDLLLSNSLAELATFLDTHPDTGLVYSDGYFCDASGQEFMRLSEHRRGNFAGNVLDHIVLDNFIVAPHCAMVRRACLESLDPPGFDEALSFSADRDVWTRLAQDYTFGYVSVPTCKYRVHGDIMSSRRSGQREDHLLYKYKVLHSAHFPSLSPTARRIFLHRMLLKTLHGEQEAQ
jgi:glycosyltransferase involved in cell wall biosynthesis